MSNLTSNRYCQTTTLPTLTNANPAKALPVNCYKICFCFLIDDFSKQTEASNSGSGFRLKSFRSSTKLGSPTNWFIQTPYLFLSNHLDRNVLFPLKILNVRFGQIGEKFGGLVPTEILLGKDSDFDIVSSRARTILQLLYWLALFWGESI